MDNEKLNTLDHILNKNLKISQPGSGYRFNADSVLLAKFVEMKKNIRNILDIGAGCGVISIILSYLFPDKRIDAVEINKDIYSHMKENLSLNNMEKSITPHNKNIKEFRPSEQYDMIITNPPYRNSKNGRVSCNREKNIARFTDSLSMEDILSFCKSFLNNKGILYFCYEADLMVDAVYMCRKYCIEPKRLMILYPDTGKPARQVFFECRKNGGTELKIESIFQKINGKTNCEYENLFLSKESIK